MNLLRAMKNAVFDKLDGTTFDSNLTRFRYTANPLPSTTSEDYPYAFFQFGVEDDMLAMGDRIPVGADIPLTFHIYSLGVDSSGDPQSSTELENLMEDLVDEFTDTDSQAVLDIQTAGVSDDWANPAYGMQSQQIIPEPETRNWHGIVRFTGIAGR